MRAESLRICFGSELVTIAAVQIVSNAQRGERVLYGTYSELHQIVRVGRSVRFTCNALDMGEPKEAFTEECARQTFLDETMNRTGRHTKDKNDHQRK